MEGCLVTERAKRLIPAVVHDRQPTLRALPKVSEGLELETIGALTVRIAFYLLPTVRLVASPLPPCGE